MAVLVFLIAATARPVALAPADTHPERMVRLPGHVLAALARAKPVPPADERTRIAETQPLLLTVVLKRDQQAEFDRYLRSVYDPHSAVFHHFLAPQQVSDRFGPSREAYQAVLHYLKANGFSLVQGSENRLTLTMRGKRTQAERALGVHIRDFEEDGRRFFANDKEPSVPSEVGESIQAVAGLSNHATPEASGIPDLPVGQELSAEEIEAILADLENLDAELTALESNLKLQLDNVAYAIAKAAATGGGAGAGGVSQPQALGAGQKIGLLAFSSFRPGDVADWLALSGSPATLLGQVSQVDVGGGAPLGPDENDVLVGITSILALAPGAQVVVYDGPLASPATSFQALLNRMINDHVNIISNSFSYCEDQTTQADAQSIDAILATAAASGISVFNATGDSGSTCQDGSANTVSVPADSPHATAVGGTSPTVGPGFTYAGESWWNRRSGIPPTGQGGFGTSGFFARPGYQTGLNSGATRSIPDVVAFADPQYGAIICQADRGGCPSGVFGGTSLATPVWAAIAGILNQTIGHRLGFLNPLLYPLAATGGFHSAAGMGSDFAHVGLGSPNVNLLELALAGVTPGPPDAAVSLVGAFSANALVPFFGAVPADGSTPGIIIATLLDANSNIIGGKTIALSAAPGSHATISPPSSMTTVSNGTVAFMVKDATVEDVTFTATDTTDGIALKQTASVKFTGPPAAAGGIAASPATVTANGTSTT
ncbi:MAG TPA: protease pro-enzyme activation domain-containing protein, partial [Candidatus Binataceae bacterium]|nr:protease pro-enzyme activation domain-containing protein [Candidatus Binataceae bacterium]